MLEGSVPVGTGAGGVVVVGRGAVGCRVDVFDIEQHSTGDVECVVLVGTIRRDLGDVLERSLADVGDVHNDRDRASSARCQTRERPRDAGGRDDTTVGRRHSLHTGRQRVGDGVVA